MKARETHPGRTRTQPDESSRETGIRKAIAAGNFRRAPSIDPATFKRATGCRKCFLTLRYCLCFFAVALVAAP